MPRKERLPKPRRGDGIKVSRALRHYLLYRDLLAASALAEPTDSKWELLVEHEHEAAWHAVEGEALAEWVGQYPGTRPTSWWWWSSPGLREVWGRWRRPEPAATGARALRCRPTGLPWGRPADETDLPMCETEAAFLDRCGLWLPAEREHVSPDVFEPRPYDVSLSDPTHNIPCPDDWKPMRLRQKR